MPQQFDPLTGRWTGSLFPTPQAPHFPGGWPPTGGKYKRWPEWYAPEADIPEQPYLRDINKLLPYMSAEDVEVLTKQLFTAGKGTEGPYSKYLAPTAESIYPAATPRVQGRSAHNVRVRAISQLLAGISDPTARSWAQSVFDTYRDWTPRGAMRGSQEEQVFKARLEELMGNIPEAAQPYAAAMQRLVTPTVRSPGREWYETPEQMRTAATNWSALGYKFNPAWR